MQQYIHTDYKLFFKIKEKTEKLYQNNYFRVFQCLLTIISLTLTLLVENNNYPTIFTIVTVVNIFVYGFIILIGILFTEDFINIFLALMLFPVSLMKGHKISDKFYFKFFSFAIIIFAAILIKIYLNHKIYNKKFKKGAFFYETVLISLCVMMGGLTTQTLESFKNYNALIYYISLGPLYIIAYLILLNNVNTTKKSQVDKFLKEFIYVGFTLSIIIIIGYIFAVNESFQKNNLNLTFFEILKDKQQLKMLIMPSRGELTQWRNLAVQIVLLMTPAVYYKIKRDKNLRSYIIGVFFCFSSMLSGSRNGLLFAFITLIFLTIVASKNIKEKLKQLLLVLILIFIFLLVAYIFIYISKTKIDKIIFRINNIEKEARILLYKEAIIGFFSHPFFGLGILYSSGAHYTQTSLGMYWFHSNIFQVIGSFGIFGIISYSILVIRRFKIFGKGKNNLSRAAVFLYIMMLFLGLFDIVGFSIFPANILILVFASFVENEIARDNKIEKQYVDNLMSCKFRDYRNYKD